MDKSRRTSIKHLGRGLAISSVLGMVPQFTSCNNNVSKKKVSEEVMQEIKKPFFEISLAQWSLHRSFFGDALKNGFGPFIKALHSDPSSLLRGTLDPMNFPIIAKNQFGVDAIEYVNTFYFDKAKDTSFLKEMKDKCDSEGVKSVLIMCDALGNLGDLDSDKRQLAVENHYQWVEAAKYLGCHAIRVNAAGDGTAEEVKDAAVQGLGALTEFGEQSDINIIVENHGGHSSNGAWLASVMEEVNHPRCGTLPDFGNFCIIRAEDRSCLEEYDRYQGMTELMPFAKGVSAKTHDFDESGDEKNIDFRKMLQIVKNAGYKGYIDIEYEGPTLSEKDGIIATKRLLEKIGTELS